MGYKSWWIDAGVIASGSADKAAEGNHYYRSMRLHKETFNALIHFRAESLTSNFTMMNVELLSRLQSLQRQPNAENLKVILDSNSFTQLFEQIITLCEGTESRMMIAYLRDVSSLLALVSAVREADFEHHLQAERDMIKQCFAFNHVNYVQYLSFQHVYLRDLEQKQSPAIEDLKKRGFGGSLSGAKFSNIHGDLITEVFNGETKRSAGPHTSGYSTNVTALNTWLLTLHLHAQVQNNVRERIRMSTSTTHKEVTPGAKRLHVSHVHDLKQKLHSYNINPFAAGLQETSPRGKR